jgi:hypothetical protein
LWFSGNNNLQGTYQLNHTTKLPTQEWAITWNDATENEVLFVKGDFVSWLRCNASSLDVLDWTNPTALGGNKLTDGKFTMFRYESSWQTSPYIFDHTVDYQKAYGDMIYSEYSEVGYLNTPGATWPNPDMPEYYATENYEYYVLVRNSGSTSSIPSIPSNTTYTLNVPEDTTCDVLVINNTQAYKATGVTLNGSYNVVVGSDSKIQQNSTDLYVPYTNLSITDSITGASVTYTANNPIVLVRYSMGKIISDVVTTQNVVPVGYLKFDGSDWFIDEINSNDYLSRNSLYNELSISRYLSNNNFSIIITYQYSVDNIVWYDIDKGDDIYIAKSGYQGTYPEYKNNFVGNTLFIKVKSCSLNSIYNKNFNISSASPYTTHTHTITYSISSVSITPTPSISYTGNELSFPINLNTINFPVNTKKILTINLSTNYDALTGGTGSTRQQTDKFYLFYEEF